MAAVTPTPYERAKIMQDAATNLATGLDKFRTSLNYARAHKQDLQRLRQEGKRPTRVYAAESELAFAKAERDQAWIDQAVDDLTVMWQELRAELDLAHVLAVTPE